MTEAEVGEALERVEAELCRRSLHTFVMRAWAIVEPNCAYVDNWHIRALCKKLEAVDRGDVTRVVINVPPGTMKSLLLVFFKAWSWTKKPHRRFFKASYGQHLSMRDNLRLRQVVTSEWYQRHFKVTFPDDQNQKIRFNTTAGGWSIATSIDGVGTGEHPDVIEVDDPISAAEARSDVLRQRANDWFDQTASSRGITRDVAIIIIMQRLHEEDLSGHVLARGGWDHLCFPMRYEKRRVNDKSWRPDPLDERTEDGELLWPALFTEEKVKVLELDLGPYGTSGQLQQRPAPEGGGLFKREWFKFVPAAPRLARRCRGWDTAATDENPKGRGDYTAGVRIAEVAGRFFLEDCRRERLGPAGVDALMLQTARSDGRYVAQREQREPGGSGKVVTAARAKTLVGFDYAEVARYPDKVSNARPLRAQVEAGNVFIVRTEREDRDAWIEPFVQELTNFPTDKHDDQVDGASTAFNEVLSLTMPVTVGPTAVNESKSYWGGAGGMPTPQDEEEVSAATVA